MKVETLKISVDCKQNDSVDIRCGGPEYLGFDFYVKKEKANKMVEYIKSTFNKLKLFYTSIYLEQNTVYLKEQEKVWTKKRIYDCIVEEADQQTYHLL